MKRTILVCSLFAAQMMLTPAFASSGSYTRSCRNIETRGRDLVATCRNQNGQWVRATLPDYLSCRSGTIVNVNGSLSCDRK